MQVYMGNAILDCSFYGPNPKKNQQIQYVA